MGGHSVTDPEMKYRPFSDGRSASDKLITNSGTQIGDNLV